MPSNLPTIGKITIGGTTLTTDPETYEGIWEKRHSVSKNIGGQVTIQDFGHYAKDMVFEINSGAKQYLTLATTQALWAAYRTRGATYTLTDWLGHEMIVFIRSFKPKVSFVADLHTYTMQLQVVSISQWFGVTYTGN